MSASFYNVSCGSLRPFPHHAARDRVRGAFPGGLHCRSACQGVWPLAAPRFAHPILESRRRNRVGLNQRFPRYAERQSLACRELPGQIPLRLL